MSPGGESALACGFYRRGRSRRAQPRLPLQR